MAFYLHFLSFIVVWGCIKFLVVILYKQLEGIKDDKIKPKESRHN